MRPKRFKMLKHSAINHEAVAGVFVYACNKHDYSLASDDTRATGKPHRSVTLDPSGDYPFFTVPISDIEEVPYEHDDLGSP